MKDAVTSMTAQTRLIAAVVVAGAAMTGMVLAQGAGTPPPAQAPPHRRRPNLRPAAAPTLASGEPASRAVRVAEAAAAGSPQFTRELAPQDVLIRGKGLYEANCAQLPCCRSSRRPEGHEPAPVGNRAPRSARRARRRGGGKARPCAESGRGRYGRDRGISSSTSMPP